MTSVLQGTKLGSPLQENCISLGTLALLSDMDSYQYNGDMYSYNKCVSAQTL